ncbi:GDSL-type esterase/lipase family protein [Arthrobacter sp. Alg241-R88]|uniref:SGNH/GDSL hydrolase family protein n=1 Tax=Arthrobacter sp. Alg241-R88 TaxID=2305984 RepID=UPI0013D425BB|nr:GDSL-type esterase/lipase family protein [Arthrobacter sp. Alg241-R88]
MKTLIAAVAAGIATTACAVTVAPTPAHANEPPRILVVGDSVTQGKDGDYSWRYFAAQRLAQERYNVDFVGPYRGTKLNVDGPRNSDGTYANPNFDQDHAARWGVTMWEALHLDTEAPTIGELVEAQQPDVIVETLGINDYSYRYGDAEWMRLVEHVNEFVTAAREAKPDVDIVLGTLPQRWEGDRVDWYNAALPGLAAELSTTESQITTTEVAAWTRGVDTYDAVHPTLAGEQKLADVVVDALTPLLPPPAPAPASPVTPEASAVPPAVTQPEVGTNTPAGRLARPAKVRADQRGVRVVVRWQRVEGAESYRVKCGPRSAVTKRAKVTVRGTAARCKVRAIGDGVSQWSAVRVKR